MTDLITDESRPEPTATGAVGWIKVTRYSALSIGLWAAVLQVVVGEFIPPVAVIGVVFVAFSPFLKGNRPKVALIVAALAMVALLGNLPLTLDELTHPSSWVTFILTALVTISALTAIVSGLAAFRGWSAEPIRAVVLSSAALFAGAVLVGVVAASGVEDATPLPGDTRVVASGIEFDLGEIVVDAGETGFWVDNQDGIRHTFTIAGTEFEIDVPGLSSARADFALDQGTYTVICGVPGHENMEIDLVVEAAGS